jgi:hypothetical protein
MEKGVLTPCTTKRNGIYQKAKKKKQAPKWIFDAETLSYAAGNSKYIFIYSYIYIYIYIKKGKIIYL